MRVAAILGPGASQKDLRPFQGPTATWLTGLPAQPADVDAVVLLGGDGTVHRHLAELVRLRLPVLVVPRGSGNDFARALRLQTMREAVTAWRTFAAGNGRVNAIDLGTIVPLDADRTAHADGAPARHYFCTVAGIGLSSEVARRANRLPRWLLGHGGYALSLPPTLLGFKPFMLKTSGGEHAGTANFQQPIFLAAVANTPAYGGGMRIAPRAQLDDGQFDVCIVEKMNKLKLLSLFPTVYFGRHLGIRGVDYFRTKQLSLETEQPCDVYADGEYVCHTPVEVAAAHGALRVIVPPEGKTPRIPAERPGPVLT